MSWHGPSRASANAVTEQMSRKARLRGPGTAATAACAGTAATAPPRPRPSLALAAAASNGSDCCNGRDVEEVDGERVDHLKVGGSGVCDGKRAGRCIRVSLTFEWASGEIAACDQFGEEAREGGAGKGDGEGAES